MSDPEPTGIVIVFTGEGKGKTTASLVTAVRAAGHGYSVALILFMKSADFSYGELKTLSGIPNISVHRYGHVGWVRENRVRPEDIKQAEAALDMASNCIYGNEHDLVILDEVNNAIDMGLISKQKLLKILKKRPHQVSLVLTGRNADAELIDMADCVTNMSMIKHHYNKEIQALKGLDY